jgi:hypothetical protein
MLRLRFRQYEKNAAASVVEEDKNRSVFVDRQIQRRWCFGLAVIGSVLAMFAIGLGFATAGVAISIAAILPFAFFS